MSFLIRSPYLLLCTRMFQSFHFLRELCVYTFEVIYRPTLRLYRVKISDRHGRFGSHA